MTFFSDYFRVKRSVVKRYGAFDVSLVTDLPLFIDPFLLFHSKKPAYRALHAQIIEYLVFLREKAQSEDLSPALIDAWYTFREVKQNWFGFSATGNEGSGLGRAFAKSLHANLHRLFPDFGKEQVTKGSHLEKLCLIADKVGRDNISDFTTNLVKGFLCEYTQAFTKAHLKPSQRKLVSVPKAYFDYDTETWRPKKYRLPWTGTDYVLLTPRDILTKDDTWINKTDLIEDFDQIPSAMWDGELRASVNNYFKKVLARKPGKAPTEKAKAEASRKTILQFPQIIDWFIRYKEQHGDQAKSTSAEKVSFSEFLFQAQVRDLQQALAKHSDFFKVAGDTHQEAHDRLAYLKDIVENKGGHRIFYPKGQPIRRESDLHIMFRLVWFGTPSDVSREANDGRGPADFKISRGSGDKAIVEFKLARNTHLERNLTKQAAIYQKASDARRAIQVIVYFSLEELRKLRRILKKLKLDASPDIVLIDARKDNKPAASKA